MELFQLGSVWDRENRNGQNQFNKDVFNAFKTLPNVDTINSYIQNLESSGTLMANIGKDFPLRSVKLGSTEPGTISTLAKNAIIDAKVFGAEIGKYYRVSFIANGYLSNGKERYGLTVEPESMGLVIQISNATSSGNLSLKNITTGEEFKLNKEITNRNISLNGMNVRDGTVNTFRDTNRRFISLAPGDNQFEITGATFSEVWFRFKYLYK